MANQPNRYKDLLAGTVRTYLRKMGPEQGGLITNDLQFIPFKETPDDELCSIGPDDIKVLTALVQAGTLAAWVHSHAGSAAPSVRDIVMHMWPIDMVIYSCRDDTFDVYDSEQLINVKAGLDDGEAK